MLYFKHHIVQKCIKQKVLKYEIITQFHTYTYIFSSLLPVPEKAISLEEIKFSLLSDMQHFLKLQMNHFSLKVSDKLELL